MFGSTYFNEIILKLLCAGEGQRNWVQVLCNGGMATQLALLYLIDCGSCERPIDFTNEYRSSWLGVAVMSKQTRINIYCQS